MALPQILPIPVQTQTPTHSLTLTLVYMVLACGTIPQALHQNSTPRWQRTMKNPPQAMVRNQETGSPRAVGIEGLEIGTPQSARAGCVSNR